MRKAENDENEKAFVKIKSLISVVDKEKKEKWKVERALEGPLNREN